MLALALQAVGAGAVPLRIVEVTAPELACHLDGGHLDGDCKVVTDESASSFALGPNSGEALLRTEVWRSATSGTGSGVRAYAYRLDLTTAAGPIARPCVTRLTLELGPLSRLDYDSDGAPDDIFVVTPGDSASIGPSAAEREGTSLSLHFARGVCAGDATYLFGLVADGVPIRAEASVRDSLGESRAVETRVPAFGAATGWWKNWQIWLVLGVVTAVGFLMMRRR